MPIIRFRYITVLLALGCAGIFAVLAFNRPSAFTFLDYAHAQSFKITFLSIILEAIPFILLGVLFSGLLQVFVTDEMIRKFTPKNPIAGVLFGGLLGLAFPLCECGMIPVVRRLIRKGMPAYIGIVYLLAGPVVNPIVFTATFTAFRSAPEMAYARLILAFAVAVIIGLIMHLFMRKSPLRDEHTPQLAVHSSHGDHHGHHTHKHDHSHSHEHHHQEQRGSLGSRLSAMLGHASDEFFEMGKYLIFGALITAAIQTIMDRSVLASVADQPMLSYIAMMAFAFILSICSTSDAFIAASFGNVFTSGPLLAFLVFGPMIDFKNMLMLLSAFRLKIVLALALLCFILIGLGSWIMEVSL
ncbi:permease [Paenibacillus sp. Leaf72]|uniref:permease n=1 Tax=Paenibacillus sp. Leaf72 TaxID=1736234 RepID=UPI0006FB7755|nr:permease [Paenibacillus sp. Leaf72]KQO01050.1 permease [Paenibacillus sp. Leaf72]